MDAYQIRLLVVCLIVSAVLLLIYNYAVRARSITKEQNDNWRLNAELLEGLVYGFDLLIAKAATHGFELDDSVIYIKDQKYHLDYERLPPLSTDHYYIWHCPEARATAVVYLTDTRELRFIHKTKVAANAYGFNSNFQYDTEVHKGEPYTRYPSSFAGLVGLVDEVGRLVARLKIGRVPLPAVTTVAP